MMGIMYVLTNDVRLDPDPCGKSSVLEGNLPSPSFCHPSVPHRGTVPGEQV